jgi:hypothetical protein
MKVDCPWCKIEMLRVDDLVYKCFYDFTNLKAPCSGWRCPKCGREMFDRKSLLNANLTIDTRPIDANALRKRVEEWIQEFSEEFSTEYRYQECDLEDLLDYIDAAPTIEVKDNG